MNFVFISPHFPENYWNFCDRLRANGVNVLGIGDAPYETLPALLKSALTEYYRVDNMENYDEMLRAMGFFTFKYGKIDWVESNNEYWLEQDARLRTDFNITTGIKSAEIEKFKRKSVMKTYYQKAGIPTARWWVTVDVTEAQAFAKTVGWPVIAKPDNGVGASDTHKLSNDEELKTFLAYKAENQFCTMVGIGIMAQIAWQVFCNIAVVTNTIPNTGISLPFFSSGGTSLILLLAEMGVMVNIGRNGERVAQQREQMRAQREAARAEREAELARKTIDLASARAARTEQ